MNKEDETENDDDNKDNDDNKDDYNDERKMMMVVFICASRSRRCPKPRHHAIPTL